VISDASSAQVRCAFAGAAASASASATAGAVALATRDSIRVVTRTEATG
jgi:hypothetical protein